MEVTILRRNSKGVAGKPYRRASSASNIFDFNAFAILSSDSEDDDVNNSLHDNSSDVEKDVAGEGGGGGRVRGRGGPYSYDNPIGVNPAGEQGGSFANGGADGDSGDVGGNDVELRTVGTSWSGFEQPPQQHYASSPRAQAVKSGMEGEASKLTKRPVSDRRYKAIGLTSMPQYSCSSSNAMSGAGPGLPSDKHHHIDIFRQLDTVCEHDDYEEVEEPGNNNDNFNKRPGEPTDSQRHPKHAPVKQSVSKPARLTPRDSLSGGTRPKAPLLKRLSLPQFFSKASSSRRHSLQLSDAAEARNSGGGARAGGVDGGGDGAHGDVLSSTEPSDGNNATNDNQNNPQINPRPRLLHPQAFNFHYGPAACKTRSQSPSTEKGKHGESTKHHHHHGLLHINELPLAQSKSVNISPTTQGSSPRPTLPYHPDDDDINNAKSRHYQQKRRALTHSQSLLELSTKPRKVETNPHQHLQVQPLTKSLHELNKKATSDEDAVTTEHSLLESSGLGGEGQLQREEGSKKAKTEGRRGSWLWSMVRKSATSKSLKSRASSGEDLAGEELATVFEDEGNTARGPRNLASGDPQSASVFTVSKDTLLGPGAFEVSPGSSIPAEEQSPVLWRRIALQRPADSQDPRHNAVMPFWHPDAGCGSVKTPPQLFAPPPPGTRCPSPLFALSSSEVAKEGGGGGEGNGRNYTALDEEDSVSLTSLSVTSLTDESSLCSSEESDGGDGTRRMEDGRGNAAKRMVGFYSKSRSSSTECILNDDDFGNEDNSVEEERDEEGVINSHRKLVRTGEYHHNPSYQQQQQQHKRNDNEFRHTQNYQSPPPRPRTTDGPHGKVFTARLVRRMGGPNGFFALSNATHVSHVLKGTVLITDMLEGKIVFAAGSGGRSSCVFAAEKGTEPWCACLTPGGHVAVTLRRPAASVTVWSGGRGVLIQEFGQRVLQGPTGVVIDRKGRFIVADERTNRVAFFSPDGEFIRYLFLRSGHPSNKQSGSAGRPQRNTATTPKRPAITNRHHHSAETDRLSDDDDDVAAGDNSKSLNDHQRLTDSDVSSTGSSNKVHRNGNSVRWSLSDHHHHQNPLPPQDNTHHYHNLVFDNDENDEERNPRYVKQDDSRPERTTTARREKDDGGVHQTTPDNANNDSDNYADCEPYVFNTPRYLCISPVSGKILVSDSGSHSVKVFSPEGVYLRSIGSYGTYDAQLKVPYGVCCDQQENVYIADHYNDRVSVFSIDGEFRQQALTSISGLSRPKSVAIRPLATRKLYVTHGGLRATEVVVYRLDSCPQTISVKCDV